MHWGLPTFMHRRTDIFEGLRVLRSCNGGASDPDRLRVLSHTCTNTNVR